MLEPGLEQILSDDDLVGCERKTHMWLLVTSTSKRQSVSRDPQPLYICLLSTTIRGKFHHGTFGLFLMYEQCKETGTPVFTFHELQHVF